MIKCLMLSYLIYSFFFFVCFIDTITKIIKWSEKILSTSYCVVKHHLKTSCDTPAFGCCY